MRAIVALLIVLMMVSGTAWARGAYKWVDDEGVVHYSDRMRGDQASIINVTIKEPEEGASDDESTEDNGEDKDKVAADSRAQAEADKKQKKIRKANCAKAREQLAANENMSRMYRLDKSGKHVYLNDKERGDVIRRSLDAVKYWCD